MKHNVKTKGFSLVELLVVISIISILMTILLPALKKARNKAQEIACANQMKQLWFAHNSYSEDNNEWVLCWRIATPTKYYWTYYLRDYLKLPYQQTNLPRTILRCPSENLELTVAATTLWTPTSYGINGHSWQASDTPKFRRPDIKQPSMWSIFMDSKGKESYWSWESYGAQNFLSYRHGKGLNVLFFDGHVKHKIYTSLPTNNNDIFWLGE